MRTLVVHGPKGAVGGVPPHAPVGPCAAAAGPGGASHRRGLKRGGREQSEVRDLGGVFGSSFCAKRAGFEAFASIWQDLGAAPSVTWAIFGGVRENDALGPANEGRQGARQKRGRAAASDPGCANLECMPCIRDSGAVFSSSLAALARKERFWRDFLRNLRVLPLLPPTFWKRPLSNPRENCGIQRFKAGPRHLPPPQATAGWEPAVALAAANSCMSCAFLGGFPSLGAPAAAGETPKIH